jgi:negative regulator of flagellin synthesis FlgM
MTSKIEGTGPSGGSLGIGKTTESLSKRVATGAGTEKVSAVLSEDSLRLTDLATELSASARNGVEKSPFDSAKVDTIKASLADGSYSLDPKLIARRLMDAEKELKA